MLQIGRILVDNAIVHTPPGTAIRVSVEAEGTRATLSVTDDGPGIPEATGRPCSSASTAWAGRSRRAAASVLRSRASLRS